MNKLFKRTLNTIFAVIFIMAMQMVVFAQGTTMISVSKSSAAVGDSITVSVTASESGTITVKYTSSMLSYVECSVSGASAEGNSVSFSGKSGDIKFTAASAGTASIIVSSSSCSGSSTTLTIGGDSASTSTSTTTETTEETTEQTETEVTVTEEPAETEETTETTSTVSGTAVGTLNSDGGFDIDGVSYVVSERYSDSEMPSGFSKTTITIGSSTYSEPTNGSITLLYLKPADNTSGSGVFYLYDETAGTVSNFTMLGDSDKYVLVQETSDTPGSAFSQTTVNVNGVEINAYTVDGAEFFYVYGTNQNQVEGWYVYDQTYGTVSRVDTSAISADSSSTSSDEDAEATTDSDNSVFIQKLALYRKIIMGLIVLCVVLLFITINRIIKNRGEDDDDFDGDVFAKSPVKASRKLPRSIVFRGRDDGDIFGDDDEDDVDEDDEYDEDYEEEDAVGDYSTSESYEERRNASLNMMDLNDL